MRTQPNDVTHKVKSRRRHQNQKRPKVISCFPRLQPNNVLPKALNLLRCHHHRRHRNRRLYRRHRDNCHRCHRVCRLYYDYRYLDVSFV